MKPSLQDTLAALEKKAQILDVPSVKPVATPGDLLRKVAHAIRQEVPSEVSYADLYAVRDPDVTPTEPRLTGGFGDGARKLAHALREAGRAQRVENAARVDAVKTASVGLHVLRTLSEKS